MPHTVEPSIDGDITFSSGDGFGKRHFTLQTRNGDSVVSHASRSRRSKLSGVIDTQGHVQAIEVWCRVANGGVKVGIDIAVANASQSRCSVTCCSRTNAQEGHVIEDVLTQKQAEGFTHQHGTKFAIHLEEDFTKINLSAKLVFESIVVICVGIESEASNHIEPFNRGGFNINTQDRGQQAIAHTGCATGGCAIFTAGIQFLRSCCLMDEEVVDGAIHRQIPSTLT